MYTVHTIPGRRVTMSEEPSPQDVFEELRRGNTRFWVGVYQPLVFVALALTYGVCIAGLSERPELSAMERRALIIAQV